MDAMADFWRKISPKIAIAAIALTVVWESFPAPATANTFCRDEYLAWIRAVDNLTPDVSYPDSDAFYADIDYTACKLNTVAVGQEAVLSLWVWLVADEPDAQSIPPIALRAAPNSTAEILGYGAAEDAVHAARITRDSENNRWFYVTLPESGVSGWVQENFIYYDLI